MPAQPDRSPPGPGPTDAASRRRSYPDGGRRARHLVVAKVAAAGKDRSGGEGGVSSGQSGAG